MYKTLDQRLVRFSKKRLVQSGKIIELYLYEKAYSYNWAPPRETGGGKNNGVLAPRRSDNLNKTRRMLQRLISSNIDAYGERPKFVTFTFRDNVTDVAKANELWSVNMRRMRTCFGRLKYLAVIEFQKRGAVHYHVLFFNMRYTRGLKKILEDTWGQGFVKVVTLGKVNNVGAYVAKYLQEDVHDIRLSGKKSYFCSRGLYKPVEYRNEEGITSLTEQMGFGSLEEVGKPKVYPSERYGTIIYNKKKNT